MTKKWIPLFLLICWPGLTRQARAEASPDAAAPAVEAQRQPTTGYFRIDTDGLGTQLWVGATHPLGDNLALGTDIYVTGTFAELDVGLAFSVGPVALLPMVGIGFDYAEGRAVSLIAPQLFTIIDASPFYFESWIQMFFNEVFVEQSSDAFYTRNFLLFQVLDELSLGPQVELTYELGDPDAELTSLPVGLRANVGYGENNTLGLFVGYETQVDENNLAGRFTFVRTW